MVAGDVVYVTCIVELTYIGCDDMTGVLGGVGAVVAHGSSVHATPISLPHVFYNCGSW